MKLIAYFLITAVLTIAITTVSTAQYADYNIDVSKKYRLENVANGKTVEVEDGLFNKGRRIQQYWGYTKNGVVDGYNQEWIFLPAGQVLSADGRSMVQVVRILNNGFLKYLSAGGSGTVNKPELQPAPMIEGADGDGSMWQIMPTNEPYSIRLRSVVNNLFLQAPANSNDGSEMELAPASNGPNQVFRYSRLSASSIPSAISGGNCIFRPANNPSMALDVTACGRGHNTLLEIWNQSNGNTCQQFTFSWNIQSNFWEIHPVIEPAYKVKLQNNTFTNGGNIAIGNPAGQPLAGWLIFEAERNRGRYMIFNRHTGKCMEVWNGRGDAGASIGQNLFNNAANQQWVIEKAQ